MEGYPQISKGFLLSPSLFLNIVINTVKRGLKPIKLKLSNYKHNIINYYKHFPYDQHSIPM